MIEILAPAIAGAPKTSPVHWIDHYIITSENVPRWGEFNAKLLGAYRIDSPRGIFQQVGPIHVGAFEAAAPLPPSAGLARGLPRYGYYVASADLGRHLSRLDALAVPHSGAVRKTDEGAAAFSAPGSGNVVSGRAITFVGGERSTNAAGIANAIYDATGVRLRSLPFTPERVRAALQKA